MTDLAELVKRSREISLLCAPMPDKSYGTGLMLPLINKKKHWLDAGNWALSDRENIKVCENIRELVNHPDLQLTL